MSEKVEGISEVRKLEIEQELQSTLNRELEFSDIDGFDFTEQEQQYVLDNYSLTVI